MLQEQYPKDNLALWNISGHRYMQILEINRELSQKEGCLVINIDWSVKGKAEETEKEKLLRQKRLIEDAIQLVEKEEKPKEKRKPPRPRTKSEQLAAGYIPTGKRGRPQKIREGDGVLNLD